MSRRPETPGNDGESNHETTEDHDDSSSAAATEGSEPGTPNYSVRSDETLQRPETPSTASVHGPEATGAGPDIRVSNEDGDEFDYRQELIRRRTEPYYITHRGSSRDRSSQAREPSPLHEVNGVENESDDGEGDEK